MKHFKRSDGFTLMELLVGITLSAVLLLAVVVIFSSTKQTFLLQDGLTRVQEDGRIAVNMIAEQIRMAGHRKPVWNDPLRGYAPLTAASVNGANSGNDTLQVMYMDDTDCRGVLNVNGDPETGEARALYKRTTFSVDNAQNLIWTCEYGADPGSLATQFSNQTVVDNVESFQVLYGVDTDFPPDFSINAWTTANNITPAASVCLQSQYLCEADGLIGGMSNGVPVSLKVALLIASPNSAGTDIDAQAYNLLDVTVPARNDSLLRKTYATTVTLRNLTL